MSEIRYVEVPNFVRSENQLHTVHVKIIVFRPLILAVDREEKEEGRWRKSRFGRFPYTCIPLVMVSSYFVSVFR